MEYLALFVILYFILRTTGNLVQLLRGTESSTAPSDEGRESAARRNGWEGQSPRQQTGAARDEPTFWGDDVEDATWHDLEEGPRSRSSARS